MDPVSHVLFGRTLIALDPSRRLGPGAIAACVLGTLAPDLDAIVISRGWDVYLRVHEAGTHSVLGSLAVASGTAALVRAIQRDGRYSSLMLAAWIGALSHLTFDLLSGATVRPGWPAFQGRLSIPLVAMADPWLIGICVAGASALWLGRRRMATIAAGVIVTIGAFLAFKGALLATALPQWTAARGSDSIVSHAVEAGWGSLSEWHVLDRTPHALRKWRVNAFGDAATLLFSVPLRAESPIVAASRSLDTVQNFLRVHQFGFAVSIPLENGEMRVLWSDIRYCWSGAGTRMSKPGGDSPLACALWFGGTFDRTGRPATQTVHVGEWLQTRPVEP